MNYEFDFNIKNYNITELENFLNISGNYDINDIDDKCSRINSVIKDSKTHDDKYKKSLEKFLNEVKLKLVSNIKDIAQEYNGFIEDYDKPIIDNKITSSDLQPPIKNYDNVGKIINPMATSHQSLQKISIPSNSINPFAGNKFIANYVFNTQFRDNFFSSHPQDCTFTLPIRIKNVISISLSAVQIPNVFLPFAKTKGTDRIYIYEETTGLEGVVTIPSGNYDATTFPPILEKAINIQLIGSWPNRFKVLIDPYTYYTTISNTTNNFRMNILKGIPDNIGDCALFKYTANANPDNVTTKNNINSKASKFVSTMGYLIGYRKIEYIGSNSYTSESMFNNIYTDYVYFCMNEYATGSQYMANYGILPQGLIDDNILAVIPITTEKFVSTFADNSDYIYKIRNYTGPIDIQKISIKLLGPQGSLVNLHSFDYGFNLQITTIYDITKPYTSDYSF
jgi:hypothetical protein